MAACKKSQNLNCKQFFVDFIKEFFFCQLFGVVTFTWLSSISLLLLLKQKYAANSPVASLRLFPWDTLLPLLLDWEQVCEQVEDMSNQEDSSVGAMKAKVFFCGGDSEHTSSLNGCQFFHLPRYYVCFYASVQPNKQTNK